MRIEDRLQIARANTNALKEEIEGLHLYIKKLQAEVKAGRALGRDDGLEEGAVAAESHKEPAFAFSLETVYMWPQAIAKAIRALKGET